VDGPRVALVLAGAALALLHFALVSCSKSCGTGKVGSTQHKTDTWRGWGLG
jgi:hypothetical protein